MFFSDLRGGDAKIAGWLEKVPEAICHPGVLPLMIWEEAYEKDGITGVTYSESTTLNEARRLGLSLNADSEVELDDAPLTEATRNMTLALSSVAVTTSVLERLEAMLNALEEFIDLVSVHVYQTLGTHHKKLNVEIRKRMAVMRARIQGAKSDILLSKGQTEAFLPTV